MNANFKIRPLRLKIIKIENLSELDSMFMIIKSEKNYEVYENPNAKEFIETFYL